MESLCKKFRTILAKPHLQDGWMFISGTTIPEGTTNDSATSSLADGEKSMFHGAVPRNCPNVQRLILGVFNL
jgi:hypothetical protein